MSDKKAALRLGIVVAVPAVLWFLPPPTGLSLLAWHLFAIYLSAILGLILQPFPEPVVILGAIASSTVLLKNTGQVLAGYANSTTWLVFCAVLISIAFVETGLGRRIAFILIDKLGRTPLGLGYAATALDFLLAPGIPSNTARDGGIIFPIMRSIAVTLESEPGPTARKIGSYLIYLIYVLCSTSSYVFLTAMAPNMLICQFAASIMKVQIDWMLWFKAAALPGILMMVVSPWLLYKIFPPEIKTLENKRIAKQGLDEMGPVTRKEKQLVALFVLAIVGWMTGSYTKIDATAIAIFITTACLFLRIITWDSIAGSKGSWTTLIWYGGIIGLAEALSKAKFFEWLAKIISNNINFNGIDVRLVLIVLVFMSMAVRYVFASGGAYVASMVPVFFTVGVVANVPPLPLAFGIAFSLAYASMLTHYGNGVAPIVFGAGYVDQTTWWKLGLFLTMVNFVVNMGLGLPWWKMLGLW